MANQYQRDAGQIITILWDLQYDAKEVARALVAAFDLNPTEVVVTMAAANYGAITVAAAMVTVFVDLGPQAIAVSLAAANYGATQVANAIAASFDLEPLAVAQALKSRTDLNAVATAAILQQLDYSAKTIARRLSDVFGKSPTQTVTILKEDLNYSIFTLVRVLNDVFNKGVNSITSILGGLGFSPAAIAAAILEVVGV